MTYYSEQDITEVANKKKKAFLILYIAIAFYLVVSVGLVWWYQTLPYLSPTITTVKAIHYSFTIVFVCLMIIYLGVYLKRIRKRYNYENNMLTGIKETSVGTFLEYKEEIQDKDGVDFKSLIFIEWNKYKNDFYERKVLVFADRPFPKIEEDAKVKYVTQSNTLIEYEYLGEDDGETPPEQRKKEKKVEKEEYFGE